MLEKIEASILSAGDKEDSRESTVEKKEKRIKQKKFINTQPQNP